MNTRVIKLSPEMMMEAHRKHAARVIALVED